MSYLSVHRFCARFAMVTLLIAFYLITLYYPPQKSDTTVLGYLTASAVVIYLIFIGLEKYKQRELELQYGFLDLEATLNKIVDAWNELDPSDKISNQPKLKSAVETGEQVLIRLKE